MPLACDSLTLTYPRTGKRGVPQQFPRRLFEMLESESKMSGNGDYMASISWSDSGRAFRILDVNLFSKVVLPRYFRTSKFSSFQRNLNLYGFSKIRRGPDTDQYAHPSFLRGYPELLGQLRKCSKGSGRIRPSLGERPRTPPSDNENIVENNNNNNNNNTPQPLIKTRPVSPTSPNGTTSLQNLKETLFPSPAQVPNNTKTYYNNTQRSLTHTIHQSGKHESFCGVQQKPSQLESNKLNLLAMALFSVSEGEHTK